MTCDMAGGILGPEAERTGQAELKEQHDQGRGMANDKDCSECWICQPPQWPRLRSDLPSSSPSPLRVFSPFGVQIIFGLSIPAATNFFHINHPRWYSWFLISDFLGNWIRQPSPPPAGGFRSKKYGMTSKEKAAHIFSCLLRLWISRVFFLVRCTH